MYKEKDYKKVGNWQLKGEELKCWLIIIAENTSIIPLISHC